jgi:teichuronic acid biosynthesis glycosyltransferase TuaC
LPLHQPSCAGAEYVIMKILTFSTLFPNAAKPHHGIFTETTLRHQLETGQIAAKVVAPVPWFPFSGEVFGGYSVLARAPKTETRIGVDVHHPRFAVLPKIGMHLAPMSLACAAKGVIGRLLDEGYDFDVIDAHYFYPDGVAAALLGKYFNKPVVISALGTDINLILRYPIPRRMILWAAAQAAEVITVCEALRTEMIRCGADGRRITTLRNGVDLQLFKPVSRDETRRALGLDGFTLLSVGYLDPRKGHHLVIQALPQLAGVRLMIAGSGPERGRLEVLARALGVAERVTFLGPLTQDVLRQYYGAADALVLASSREGWANVLLEAMACGTPVVASNVWGTPEVVRAPAAGVLMDTLTAQGVADGVRRLRANYPDHAATRAYAQDFGWDETTRGQIRLFHNAAMRPLPLARPAACKADAIRDLH